MKKLAIALLMAAGLGCIAALPAWAVGEIPHNG